MIFFTQYFHFQPSQTTNFKHLLLNYQNNPLWQGDSCDIVLNHHNYGKFLFHLK